MITYIPHFKNDKIIAPPEGYFILPGHISPNGKFKDKYCYNGKWKISINSGIATTKETSYTYARPIKGNEELYNQMAFLPEKIINPPEEYYLLPANVKLEKDDIGYWKCDDKWMFEAIDFDFSTPLKNYNEYKHSNEGSVIAFARKIEIKKDKKMKNYTPRFSVRCKSLNEIETLLDLVKKFGYEDNTNIGYKQICIYQLKENEPFYLNIHLEVGCLGWDKSPTQSFTYENFDINEITNHIIAVTGKTLKQIEVDYVKYPNFQVKIENEEQYNALVKLGAQYYTADLGEYSDSRKYIQFTYDHNALGSEYVTWNPTAYRPNDYYTYETFNIDQIKKHLDIVNNKNKNMKNDTQAPNSIVNIDYIKTPNFAVKIDNDNTRVMLLALGEKFGMTKHKADFEGEKLGYIAFNKVNNNLNGANKILSGYKDTFSKGYYIYESVNWDAIIKHFEAPIEIVPEVPVVHGYTMKYIKGSITTTFGCANISIKMLRDVYQTMYLTYDGNRKINSIILENDGTVTKTITKNQIKEILEYVDYVNKKV